MRRPHSPAWLREMDAEKKQRIFASCLLLLIIGLVGVASVALKAKKEVDKLGPRVTVIEKTITKRPQVIRIIRNYTITKVVTPSGRVITTSRTVTIPGQAGSQGPQGTPGNNGQNGKEGKKGKKGKPGVTTPQVPPVTLPPPPPIPPVVPPVPPVTPAPPALPPCVSVVCLPKLPKVNL